MQPTSPFFKSPWTAASLSLPQEGGPIRALPPEILEKIFEYLTASNLAHFTSVCSSWKQKADEGEAWQVLLKRDFPWAHRALSRFARAELDETVADERQITVDWSRAYRAWALEKELWNEEHCLKGHTGGICCMISLPDGRLATGSSDHTARIWSLEGKELHVLRGHTNPIVCMTSLSDRRLATGSSDRTARIWSTEGQELHVLQGHIRKIWCITSLPDGRLATGSEDQTARIWSSEGQELHVLRGHTALVHCMTSLPDGRLATGSEDRTVRI